MEALGTSIIILISAYMGVKIIATIVKENEEKQSRIIRMKSRLEANKKELLGLENSISIIIHDFFISTSGDYDTLSNSLNSVIYKMQQIISDMKIINLNLKSESRKENQENLIAQIENRVITRGKHIVNKLNNFSMEVYSLPYSEMMDSKSYGKINKDYWDSVCDMQKTDVMDYINRCMAFLNKGLLEDIITINIKKVLKCILFLAIEKTFSASDFHKAKAIFWKIYRCNYVDVDIAEFYSKKKMGGEEAIREDIRNILKSDYNANIFNLIASSLMWMNAYQSESMVLQHMLTHGMEMNAKAQERLHSLTNGGGNAPSGFDVSSSNDSLYFDVSALTWRENDYIGLFENLAFQDKILTYSLAIRDENKDLFLTQGISIPSISVVLEKLKTIFDEEYGTTVVAQSVNCILLSGSGEEKMDGILVYSKEYRQMGILIHIAGIGKKLIIKFYTLFMPVTDELATQKQQALSMYKKLSPSISMWESSLKDTMLMAIEQLINTSILSEKSVISENQENTIF